jgi:hypothetical protein
VFALLPEVSHSVFTSMVSGCAGEGEGEACPTAELPAPAPTTFTDVLSPQRLLRRTTLTLTGRPPTDAQRAALDEAADDAARAVVLDGVVEEALASTSFYEQLVAFGHDWIKVGRYTTGAQGEAYWGHMSGSLFPCGADSIYAGALYVSGDASMSDDPADVCNGLAWDRSGALADVPVVELEPWWAPGTTVRAVGRAGFQTRTHPSRDGTSTTVCGLYEGVYFTAGLRDDANNAALPACSCGPNLLYCSPDGSGFAQANSADDNMQRRMAWDEPARLLAHIAVHGRPLSDLVVGDYSVGPNKLRHLYLRHARQNPANLQLDDNTFWKNDTDVLADPLHDSRDPMAWREFKPSDVHPHLLAERDYHYDPRTTTEESRGLPTAGVLTMMGSQSAFARERVRAARWLEIFACKDFVPPPATQEFSPFDVDPATTGTCQHCHTLIDPVAIHFKRWDFGGHYIGPTPMMPGIGPWLIPTDYTASQFPYARWRQSYIPNTVLTPITEEELAANEYARFLEFLPEGQSVFGAQSDGTVGPLGFGKMLVASGEFDRCAVRRLSERFLGRDLDPAKEAGYIDALVEKFVANDRQLKPFVRTLLREPAFGRGL